MKYLFSVIAIFLSVTVFAQVEKGDFSATGSLSYQNFSSDGFSSSTGQLFLKGGYFFTQNLEAGTSLQVFLAEGAEGFGIGPYATYNFLTTDGKLLPYAGGQLSILSLGDSNLNTVGLYGGSKYFLNETVNVDFGLSLQKGFGDFDGTLFGATLGIGVLLGKLK